MPNPELDPQMQSLLMATHNAAFEMGMAACRAALVEEFGRGTELTERVTGVIDDLVVAYQQRQQPTSRTISVRPSPPIRPLPGANNG